MFGPSETPAARRRPHEQPAARRHARAHRRQRRPRAGRRRDGARARRPPGRDGRPPDRGRPGRLPRDPPPPARAALSRARLRHEPAALVRRHADRPRAGRARRRPAAARSALARDGGPRRGRAALGERAADARVRARALPRRRRAAGAGGGRRAAKWHTRRVPFGRLDPPGRPRSACSTRDGNAASLTCSTGCGSGVVVPGTGVHLNNMLGETDLNVASLKLAPGMRLTSMMAPSLVLDGRAGRARPRLVGVGAHPLGDRAGRRRGARSRACRCRRRSSSRACIRRATCSTARAASRPRRSTRSRPPGEQVVRWPGRNIYFGGAQVVARTRDGLRGGRRSAPRRRGHRRRRLTRTGGERTADCLRSRCDDRTRLFEHPRVRSTLQTLRLDPRPAIVGFRA